MINSIKRASRYLSSDPKRIYRASSHFSFYNFNKKVDPTDLDKAFLQLYQSLNELNQKGAIADTAKRELSVKYEGSLSALTPELANENKRFKYNQETELTIPMIDFKNLEEQIRELDINIEYFRDEKKLVMTKKKYVKGYKFIYIMHPHLTKEDQEPLELDKMYFFEIQILKQNKKDKLILKGVNDDSNECSFNCITVDRGDDTGLRDHPIVDLIPPEIVQNIIKVLESIGLRVEDNEIYRKLVYALSNQMYFDWRYKLAEILSSWNENSSINNDKSKQSH